MEGHRFEPQRAKRLSQRSLQCKPSCYHAAVGKVHYDYTNHAPQEDPHTLRYSQSIKSHDFTRSNRKFQWPTIVTRLLSIKTHGLANWCCGTLRLMISILRWISTISRWSSQANNVRPNKILTKTVNFTRLISHNGCCDTRNRAEIQYNLLPPSSHILCMSNSLWFNASNKYCALNDTLIVG